MVITLISFSLLSNTFIHMILFQFFSVIAMHLLASGMFYGLFSLVLLIIHRNTYSKENKNGLFAISGLLFFVPALVVFVDATGFLEEQFRPALMPYIIVTAVLYIMGFKLIKGPKGYINKILNSNKEEGYKVDKQKLSMLSNLIESDKLFLDSSITVQKISEASGLSRHEISKLVNIGLGKTFNELINEYRIKAVLEQFDKKTHNHLSIIGIAYESGFKSKATFIKYFKKYNNCTPSQYLQDIKSK